MSRYVAMNYIMSRYVAMKYIFSASFWRGSTVDEVSKFVNGIRDGQDFLQQNYGDTIDCTVSNSQERGGSYFIVEIKEKSPGSLEPALRKFFEMAGTPYFVRPGSDYDLVERVLQPSGKKLKGIIGRTVKVA